MGVVQLSREKADSLRVEFSAVENTDWVVKLARQKGWRQANSSYLEAMRAHGADEMALLMDAAGVSKRPSVDEARQLLLIALSLWAPQISIKQLPADEGEAHFEIRVVDCPTYRRIEAACWRGVTACGGWHHRQGWYDALGIAAEDTLLREMKWGFGACVIDVELRLRDQAATTPPNTSVA